MHFNDVLKFLAKHRILKYTFMNKDPRYSKYSIGKFTYGDPEVRYGQEQATLTIGKFCSIADNVIIFLGGDHRQDWVTTFPFNWFLKEFSYIKGGAATKGNVIIGNDVWIGTHVLILSGVKIGDGAVVGASSVVTKDVDPYAIVAGNPARTIGMRFDQETISHLLKIKWWDWDIQRIKDNIPFLLSDKLKKFIDKNLVSS